jgi:hypothetical protein
MQLAEDFSRINLRSNKYTSRIRTLLEHCGPQGKIALIAKNVEDYYNRAYSIRIVDAAFYWCKTLSLPNYFDG